MTRDKRRGDAIVAWGLFGLALSLGGGSVGFPLPRLVVELAAALCLGWYGVRGWRADAGRSTAVAMGLLILTLLLIGLQLVPLPPAVWRQMPGRLLAAGVLDTVGASEQWMPVSLDPSATQATAFYFLVPLVLFVGTVHLDRNGQVMLLRIFVGFALVNGLLVILQSQGMAWLTPYMTGGTRPGTGLFANKNHCATMLVMAMPAAAAVSQEWRRTSAPAARRMAGGVMVGFLAMTVFGCLSRAGLALLPIGLGASVFILLPRNLSRRHLLIGAGLAIAVLIVAAIILPQTHIVEQALIRFNSDQDERYNFWPDVLKGIRHYFPIGSGLGTFVPVYATEESLVTVHRTYTNHAHSDYLEIALETGVAGLALVGAFLVWFAVTVWHRMVAQPAKAGMPILLVALIGIVILLCHSAVDYPLRTLALAGSMAVFGGILASTAPFQDAASEVMRYRRRTKGNFHR